MTTNNDIWLWQDSAYADGRRDVARHTGAYLLPEWPPLTDTQVFEIFYCTTVSLFLEKLGTKETMTFTLRDIWRTSSFSKTMRQGKFEIHLCVSGQILVLWKVAVPQNSDPDNLDREKPCGLNFNFFGEGLFIKQKISSIQVGIGSKTFYICWWCNFVKSWHQLRRFAIHERCFHAMHETMSMT